jgi:hypothetical protein
MDRTSILSKQVKKNIVVKMAIILLTILSCYTTFSLAAESSVKVTSKNSTELWKVWRTDDDLIVSYRPSSRKNLIEIKAQAKLASNLSGFIYFIEDLKQMPLWLDNAESASIIEQIAINENVFITRFNGLWPVSAREMVVHSRYWQNNDLSVEIAVDDAGTSIEKNKGFVRMQVHSAHWKITPTAFGQIEVSYQFVVDPRGNIPQWLTKPMTLIGIWTTLNNLREQLPNSKWQQVSKSGIEEQH